MPINAVAEFESKALQELKANHPEYLAEIADKKVISEELETKLTSFYQDFAKRFGDGLEKAA